MEFYKQKFEFEKTNLTYLGMFRVKC